VSITFTGIGREQRQLVRFAIEFLGVRRCISLDGDIGPFGGVFGVELEHFFQTGFSIRLDRFSRAFGLTDAAVDAFIRVDDQHVLAFIETVDGTDFDAVHVFALDAVFGDNIGHSGVPGELRLEALANGAARCILFLRLAFNDFVEACGGAGGAAAFRFCRDAQDLHAGIEREGENVTRLGLMARLGHALLVETHMALINQRPGIAAMPDQPGVDQPFVDALAQRQLSFMRAFRACSTAKGEFGSGGRSGRGELSTRGFSWSIGAGPVMAGLVEFLVGTLAAWPVAVGAFMFLFGLAFGRGCRRAICPDRPLRAMVA
jgi:hypothetical protein